MKIARHHHFFFLFLRDHQTERETETERWWTVTVQHTWQIRVSPRASPAPGLPRVPGVFPRHLDLGRRATFPATSCRAPRVKQLWRGERNISSFFLKGVRRTGDNELLESRRSVFSLTEPFPVSSTDSRGVFSELLPLQLDTPVKEPLKIKCSSSRPTEVFCMWRSVRLRAPVFLSLSPSCSLFPWRSRNAETQCERSGRGPWCRSWGLKSKSLCLCVESD